MPSVAITPRLPRHLRLPEVQEIVPYSKVHLYRLIKRDLFPRPVRFGENRIAWNEDDIVSWLMTRTKAA